MVCLIAPGGKVRLVRRGPGQGAADEAAGERGRGAWVHPRCLAAALEAGALMRAFRRRVEVSDRETLLAQAHAALGRFTDGQGDAR
ncbi:MAG: DUF448 domain-containing protein [Deltaproteobacteria bacterium]|nr:DUF448 domain-containing protein [Deltaproteobacteria bacterium]